ncbi:MAG: nucleoside monophosphate kinase, partial [Candidatus Nanopelagicales bacterium]
DGYPRTVEQVSDLDAMLRSDGLALDAVVELRVDMDEVVGRLVKRAADQGRSDDSEAVIRRRLEVYVEQTAPLLALYRDKGLLVPVDGLGPVDDVTGRIVAALGIGR